MIYYNYTQTTLTHGTATGKKRAEQQLAWSVTHMDTVSYLYESPGDATVDVKECVHPPGHPCPNKQHQGINKTPQNLSWFMRKDLYFWWIAILFLNRRMICLWGPRKDNRRRKCEIKVKNPVWSWRDVLRGTPYIDWLPWKQKSGGSRGVILFLFRENFVPARCFFFIYFFLLQSTYFVPLQSRI